MPRTSDKHGPRVDEGLKAQVDPPPVTSDGEVVRRRTLGRFVERKFPATREEILEGAIELHAPPDVIDQLHDLPPGSYEGFPEVWAALNAQDGDGHKQ